MSSGPRGTDGQLWGAPARGRYDDLKSGRVKPIDGEEVFRRLHQKGERGRPV